MKLGSYVHLIEYKFYTNNNHNNSTYTAEELWALNQVTIGNTDHKHRCLTSLGSLAIIRKRYYDYAYVMCYILFIMYHCQNIFQS